MFNKLTALLVGSLAATSVLAAPPVSRQFDLGGNTGGGVGNIIARENSAIGGIPGLSGNAGGIGSAAGQLTGGVVGGIAGSGGFGGGAIGGSLGGALAGGLAGSAASTVSGALDGVAGGALSSVI